MAASVGSSAMNCRAAACWRFTALSPDCFRLLLASAAAQYRTRSSPFTGGRCIRRSAPQPESAFRSQLPAPLATCSPAGRIWPCCRLCRSVCLADRLRTDGAGVELHDDLRRTTRALVAAAEIGNCLRHLPRSRSVAFCCQHDLAAVAYGVPRRRSLSPWTSQLCSRLRKLIPSRLFLS